MSRIKNHHIRKFNPGAFQSDEEVIEQFVVRNHELQTVLDILHDNIEAPSCQHTLIIGPRGQGKTMLLARTAAELRSNEQFSENLLPVRFMEESQEIFNMADFWLETLFHLARECQQFDPQLGQELNIRHSALSKKWGSDSLEDLARNAVLDVADQLGRKLVLMIENLQALFEDVDEDFGWKLRKVLQTEPQVILVGSATSRFKGLDDAKLPFFEFFWTIHLKPLNTIECQQLWTTVSGKKDMSEREIRPLEILTGGSPRLLVVVASFAQHKSVRQLMEELVLLIDEHTDYFRGNLEVLAKTERRVFLAVIDLWQSSTPSEISIRARMDIRKVSTMLGRLVNRGAVIAEGSGRKRKYVAAERLYSIYYKLRRNRDEAAVVESLIRFMSVFYTEVEQREVFSSLLKEMAESAVIREALNRAMTENPEITTKLMLTRINDSNILREISSGEDRRFKEMIILLFDGGDFAKVIQAVDQVLSSQSSNAPQLHESSILWALLLKAAAYQKQENIESALLTVSEIINRWGTSEDHRLRYLVINALTIKSELLQVQGKLEPALLTLKETRKHFDTVKAFYQQWSFAHELVNKGKKLQAQGQVESALSTFEEVVERFGNTENLELQYWVAKALINKGEILQAQDQLESALSAFKEVVERFSNARASDLQVMVSLALLHKIEALYTSSEPIPDVIFSAVEEGIEFINAIEYAKLSTAMRLPLQKILATILLLKGTLLRARDKIGPAKAAFEKVIERFGAADNSELQIWSIKALIRLTELQTNEGNIQDALHTYSEITRRLGEIDVPGKSELTWEALRVGTQTLLTQRDLSAAVDSFRSLYSILEPDNEAMIRVISDFVINLIAAGVTPHTLLKIFSSNDAREEALLPVIVALKQEAGESVRAPKEVHEVAVDIRKDIQKKRESLSRNRENGGCP